MIADDIKNIGLYQNIHPKFKLALEFLMDNEFSKVLPGKYSIDGDNVFALVQAYTTRPEEENRWEAHKKYIDIQFVEEGTEVMGWIPVSQLVLSEEYSTERDIAFYDDTAKWSNVKLNEGQFAIFFPDDGHKPCCMDEVPSEVKKVVVKVKL